MTFAKNQNACGTMLPFAPIVHMNNSTTNTNKCQKNNSMLPTSTTLVPSTAIVMQQPLQQMLLPHPLIAAINGSSAGLAYRGWGSLLSDHALNSVTVAAAPNPPPQDPLAHHEQIDHPPPPPEAHNSLSSLQLALLSNVTSDDMEADNHINSATRKADVSDGRSDWKLKKKKGQGGERKD